MFDFAVLGRAVWDDWQDLRISNGGDSGVCFGGNGANVAVNLAGLGLHPTLITILGTGGFSDKYRRHLIDRGVNFRLAKILNRELPRCEMWVGHRSLYRWDAGYDGLAALADLVSVGHKCVAREMFFADFPLARITRDHLASVSYCSPQLTLFNGQSRAELLTSLPWRGVFANRVEAAEIERQLGMQLAAASALTQCTLWFVTNEDQPTLVYENGAVRAFRVPEATVVDSRGGGDAFAAAVCAGLYRKLSLEMAVKLGHAVAQLAVQQVGCQASVSDLSQLAREYGL